jgi:hypothetical protein
MILDLMLNLMKIAASENDKVAMPQAHESSRRP